MAPRGGEGLLAWAREVRGCEGLEADADALEEIRAFLIAHEAESGRAATHVVLENYLDWWLKGRARAPAGLCVEEPQDLEELYRYAGLLFDRGIPLTLGERRTPLFRLFQDVTAWGSKEASLKAEDLIGPDTALTRFLGTSLNEVFPGHSGFLDAAVYDATGIAQTKGMWKTSLRLVWPMLVVDTDRASRVRDLLVNRLVAAAAEGGAIAELQAQLLERNSSNAWYNVLSDAAYAPRSPVRTALSDQVSPLPLRAPERRPLAPVGVIRFTFLPDDKMKVEWLCRAADLESAEWAKIGSVRLPAATQLTEWTVPAFQASQPMPPSRSRPGRVKVRTAGGSEGGMARTFKVMKDLAPERAGQITTVERSFSGPPEQFCDRIEQRLGKASVEPDGALVWKQPNGDARVMVYSEDKRVKVTGRPNQVRSLLVVVAPFCEAAQHAVSQPRSNGGASPAALDGRAPSEAYAPSPSADDEKNSSASTADGEQESSPSSAGQMRLARQDFEPQGQGELGLSEGDVVCVTHDPEGEQGGGSDRWVYGRSEATGLLGWFPLSHTMVLEDRERGGAEA